MGIKDIKEEEGWDRALEWYELETLSLASPKTGKHDLAEVISVADLRRVIGTLRGGRQCKIVLYRGRPACIAVPHPIDVWQDSLPFLGLLTVIRNSWLEPPYSDPPHPWALEQAEVQIATMEAVRRGTAQVFAHLLRNNPFILTYYEQYEVMTLLPVPSDIDPVNLAAMAMIMQRLLRFPGVHDVLDVTNVKKFVEEHKS